MSDVKNKIVLAEGTEQEKTIYLQKPKGRKARETMPKVLTFMAELSKNTGSNDMNTVSNLVSTLWSKSDFEDNLVPFVLQLDNPEGRRYLDENCTLVEILEAFSKAAQYLLEESFQRPEVQEALGKSIVEVQETQKTKK